MTKDELMAELASYVELTVPVRDAIEGSDKTPEYLSWAVLAVFSPNDPRLDSQMYLSPQIVSWRAWAKTLGVQASVDNFVACISGVEPPEKSCSKRQSRGR